MTAHRLAFLAILLTALIGTLFWVLPADPEADEPAGPKPKLGLMTSLPIYWDESTGFDGALADDQPLHWVRAQLEEDFELVPLDALAGADTAEPNATLDGLELLLVAQPRALPPADFAALDAWVRGGGHLLMFADPSLTEHSDFGLGDPRRPLDYSLMSPILARWGLEQLIEQSSDSTTWFVPIDGVVLPVRDAGRLQWVSNEHADCTLLAGGVIATCQIGQGRALIVSDAAVLEREGDLEVSGNALGVLVSRALTRRSENESQNPDGQ